MVENIETEDSLNSKRLKDGIQGHRATIEDAIISPTPPSKYFNSSEARNHQ